MSSNNQLTAVFIGSKSLGLSIFKSIYAVSQHLKWIVIHPDDSQDKRSDLKGFQDLARLCDIDILVASSAHAAKQMIKDFEPDIGFVCGWYWLIDSETLSVFPKGLWGIHNSLLPKYRGGAPLVWSILSGDSHVGSTVFKISEGMDDGDILHQVKIEVLQDDNVGTLLLKIENDLVESVPGKWLDLVSCRADLMSQSNADATYCGQRIESDGVINWSIPAKDVHNFIRSQSPPYPCAYSFLNGSKIRFVDSSVAEGIYFGTPGQIIFRKKEFVVISCGQNTAIEIRNVVVDDVELSAYKAFKSSKDRLSLL